MEYTDYENKFWEYESNAKNNPLNFLKALPVKKRNSDFPELAWSILEAIASATSGKLSRVEIIVNKHATSMQQQDDNFLAAKYYLLKKRWLETISYDTSFAEELLQLAEKHQKLSGSKALECEVLLCRCLQMGAQREFTSSEEMLQKAIHLAVETGISELIIDAYISYAKVCQLNQYPDLANREFQLLFEFPDLDKYPHAKVYMLNLFAVNLLMTDNPNGAEDSLNKAYELSRQFAYEVFLANVLMNMGITAKLKKKPYLALENYDKCLEKLESIGAGSSQLAVKAAQNKANILGLMGRMEEASQILAHSLENAIKNADEPQINLTRINLADLLIELKKYPQALDLLDKAIEYYVRVKNYNYLQNAYLCKARYYEEQEAYKEAFENMENLYSASRMHFKENYQTQSQKYQARISSLRNQYLVMKSACKAMEVNHTTHDLSEQIGNHPSMRKAVSEAMLASRHPFANVIIYGESGTGKELLARLIHNSTELNSPMVAINASAIPANLIESELFGHVKGAFTGAISEHKGKFQLANNSTLFLDEIAEMPLDVQSKLLRAIEYQAITPVGSDIEIKVRCRIICATNKDLRELIHANKFRLDLYHRLNKVEITLPPLRERLSDLGMIADYYVQRFSREYKHPVPSISEEFYEKLRDYSFPGNIRELANMIERIFILKAKPHWDAEILEGIIPNRYTGAIQPVKAASQHLKNTEYLLIMNTLENCNWVQKEAARILNMTESTLSRHIRKLQIVRPG